MPITVQCESCFQSHRVRDDKAGTVIKCKDCGARIKVPASDAEAFDADDFEEAPGRPKSSAARKPARGKKRSSDSGSSKGLLIAGGAIGGVLLIAGIVMLLMRGGGEAPKPGAGDVAAVPPPAAGAAAAPGQNPAAPNAAAPGSPEVAKMSVPAPGSVTDLGPGAAKNPVAGQAAAKPAAAPSAPAAAQDVGGWKVTVDPPAVAMTWPEKLEVNITIPGRGDVILYPSVPSPFVAFGFEAYESAGAQMWNMVTGKKVGEIRGEPSKQTARAISPDGKYLAVHVLDLQARNKVEFWSFETGKMVSVIDCDDLSFNLSIMDFAGPDQFFSYTFGKGQEGKFWHRFKIWDIPGGTALRQMEMNGGDINQYIYAFSPGRRYFATMQHNNTIFIYDLQSGKQAGKVMLPQASEIEQHLSAEWLTFSPDGQQLFALLDGPKETRIMTVDVKTGERDPETDSSFPGRLLSAIWAAASYKGPKFECLPGNAGFLLAGDVWIDGKSGRLVWYINRGTDLYNHTKRVPVPNGVIMTEGTDNARRLAVVEVPWKQIESTLEAIKEEKPAHIRPGKAVSLDIQIGKLQYGKAEDTKAALAEVLTERLAAEGIEVKDGEPVSFRVTYQEAKGNTLQESQRNPGSPILGGTPTGRSVEATKVAVNLSWRKDNGKVVVWSKDVLMDPSFLIFRGELTAENARNSMFEGLKNSLFAQPIPYFIPEDKTLVQLPGSTELKNPNLSASGRTKARLDAAKKKKK